jgi:hypothetical protein
VYPSMAEDRIVTYEVHVDTDEVVWVEFP